MLFPNFDPSYLSKYKEKSEVYLKKRTETFFSMQGTTKKNFYRERGFLSESLMQRATNLNSPRKMTRKARVQSNPMDYSYLLFGITEDSYKNSSIFLNLKASKPLSLLPFPKITTIMEADVTSSNFFLHQICFYNDTLALGLGNKVVLSTQEANNIFDEPEGDISAVHYFANEEKQRLAYGTLNGLFIICYLNSNDPVSDFTIEFDNDVVVDCITHCGENVFFGLSDGRVCHIDAKQNFKELTYFDEPISSLQTTANGSELLIGIKDKIVNFPLNSNETETSFEEHRGGIRALAPHPKQNNLVASGGGRQDKILKLWDLKTKEVFCSLEHPGQITGCHWSSDGKYLVTISYEEYSIKSYIRIYKLNMQRSSPQLNLVTEKIPEDYRRSINSALSQSGTLAVLFESDYHLVSWDLSEIFSPQAQQAQQKKSILELPVIR